MQHITRATTISTWVGVLVAMTVQGAGIVVALPVELVASRAGVGAVEFAGAGLTTFTVPGTIAAIPDKSEREATIMDLSTRLRDAFVKTNQVARASFRGGSTPVRQVEMQASATLVRSLQRQYTEQTDALRDAVTQAISQVCGLENAAAAERMGLNTHRRVPEAFTALDLNSDTWHVLERAWLKYERNEQLTPGEHIALATAQSNTLVQTVTQRIATNSHAIETWMYQQVVAAVQQAQQP